MLARILLAEALVLFFGAHLLYNDQWVAAFTLLAFYVVTLLMLLVRPRGF